MVEKGRDALEGRPRRTPWRDASEGRPMGTPWMDALEGRPRGIHRPWRSSAGTSRGRCCCRRSSRGRGWWRGWWARSRRWGVITASWCALAITCNPGGGKCVLADYYELCHRSIKRQTMPLHLPSSENSPRSSAYLDERLYEGVVGGAEVRVQGKLTSTLAVIRIVAWNKGKWHQHFLLYIQ